MLKVVETEQNLVFLTLMGSKLFTLVSDLVSPKEPEECTLVEIIDKLDKHFKPHTSEIYERFLFHSRKQTEGETVTEFVAALKKQSAKCNFGEFLKSSLRDQFILGLSNTETQRHLFTQDDLDFEGAIKIATAKETAIKEVKGLKNPKNDNEEVNKIAQKGSKKKPQNKTSTPKGNNSRQPGKCTGCGRAHWRSDCPFKEATCHGCGVKGHLRSVCRSQTSKPNAKNSQNFSQNSKGKSDSNCNAIDSESSAAEYVFHTSEEPDQPVLVPLKVNGKVLSFELDTGTFRTIVPHDVFRKNFPNTPLNSSNAQLRSYGNNSLKIAGETKVTVESDGNFCKLPITVLHEKGRCLVGRNWIKSLGLLDKVRDSLCHVSEKIHSVDSEDFTKSYPLLFREGLGLMKKFKVHIELDENVQPKYHNSRPVPYALREKVTAALDELVEKGTISPVNSSKWASAIVPVLKPDKSVRICGDFRIANKAVVTDKYPIPRSEDLFSSIAGGKYFTKLDMAAAYNQLELDDESKCITTINTPKGLFQFNRLCFGISSSPGIFQRAMDQLLKNVPGVLCFLDDILISGETKKIHDERVKQVLSILQEAGLTLNAKKCQWRALEISYLGFRVDKDGIHPSEDKIAAIRNAPAPKDIKGLQAYLGLLNFYRKFIPNASSLLEPLNLLLRKETSWVWGVEQQKAFQKSKQILTSDSVLVHFDAKHPIIVTADSSSYGIGAVLALKIDGQERPVAYVSRTLNSAERNYCQTEKEALALVYAVKKFHFYLYGQNFTAVTDHKPLLGLFSHDKQISVQASGRIQRWSLILQAYKFNLVHKSGKTIGNADALSRLPIDCGNLAVPVPTEWVNLVEFLSDTPITAQKIAAETKNCEVLSKIKKFLLEGWPNSLEKSDEIQSFSTRRAELCLQEGCVLWGNRVVIPKSLRQNVLSELHVSHPGMTRMKELARSYLWFPNIDREIEKFVENCDSCQERRSSPKSAPLHPWEWPQNAWFRLHIDHAGPFLNKYFFIVVDSYSKWPEIFIVNSINSQTTINCLRSVFARFGIAPMLVSDNGPAFVSEEFRKFTEMNGIRHVRVAPYHPASNGLAENMVKNMKRSLAHSREGGIQKNLDNFLMRYRVTPHSTTGKTPAELLLKRKIRCVFDLLSPEEITRNRVQQKQESQKKYHDPKAPRKLEVSPTSDVRVRNYTKGPKWVPGRVVEKTGPVSYKVALDDEETVVVPRHQDQLHRSVDTTQVNIQPRVVPTVQAPVTVDAPRTLRQRENIQLPVRYRDGVR